MSFAGRNPAGTRTRCPGARNPTRCHKHGQRYSPRVTPIPATTPAYRAPPSLEENPMKRKIHFDRDGLTLVGNLFTPEAFEEHGRYPAVIVQGSFTSVKEQ